MKHDIGRRQSMKGDGHAGRAMVLAIIIQDADTRQALLSLGRMILEHPTVPTGIVVLIFAGLAREVIRDSYRYQWSRRR